MCGIGLVRSTSGVAWACFGRGRMLVVVAPASSTASSNGFRRSRYRQEVGGGATVAARTLHFFQEPGCGKLGHNPVHPRPAALQTLRQGDLGRDAHPMLVCIGRKHAEAVGIHIRVQ